MHSRQFKEKLSGLHGPEFEDFVADVLEHSDRFSEIQREVRLGGFIVDILAIEKQDGLLAQPKRWLFEIKNTRVVAPDVLYRIDALAQESRSSGHGFAQLVLVTNGHLTHRAREYAHRIGIEIWDSAKLGKIATDKVQAQHLGQPVDFSDDGPDVAHGDNLLKLLRETEPGRAAAASFQKISSDILEFLFCPPLESPLYELPDSDSRNRRDMILENPAQDGFWAQIRGSYDAHYVVVDAKNHAGPLKKRPVLDIAHYLKPYGCGLFGMLISRKGPGAAAEHAIREQWIGARKMVIVIGDQDVEEMVRMKAEGGRPEEILRRHIAAFRMGL